MASKACNKCKLEKPASQFYYRKQSKDRLDTQCSECRRTTNRKSKGRIGSGCVAPTDVPIGSVWVFARKGEREREVRVERFGVSYFGRAMIYLMPKEGKKRIVTELRVFRSLARKGDSLEGPPAHI